MRFFNRKPENSNPQTEQIAGRIAGRIVKWQLTISAKVNGRVNRFTKASQRKFLWVFCAVWIAVVCYNFFRGQQHQTIKGVKPNYLPAHIGQASDLPKHLPEPIQKTDSLTIKK
jgi:hypothetical protein